jgi:hypothetical protein
VNLALGLERAYEIGSIRPVTIILWSLPEERKKRKLWEVDPTVFAPGHKASFFERRVIPTLRQLGKFGLYALAMTYPIYLVYVGVAFGGLAFWGFLAGSIAIMGIIITKLGYASNFRHWDISLKRTLGLLLGFPLAVGFYAGLIYLKTLLLPVAFALAALGFLLILKRSKS